MFLPYEANFSVKDIRDNQCQQDISSVKAIKPVPNPGVFGSVEPLGHQKNVPKKITKEGIF